MDDEARAMSITAAQLRDLMDQASAPMVLDVRDKVQFAICSLPGSINIPLRKLPKRIEYLESLLGAKSAKGKLITIAVVVYTL